MEQSQVYNPQALNTTFESEGFDNDYKEQRFSIKKELFRGIKDNDVNKIVSRATDRQQQEDFKYDQYTDIHNVLTQKRRNYDEHKTVTNSRKRQIQALKKQISDLLLVENSLKQTIQFSKQELNSVDQGLEQTKQEYQYTAFRKDVYDHIMQRSNKIYLVEKKRLFDLELELQKVRNHHRSCVMEAANKKKLEQKCRKMLVSIEKVVGFQKKGRQHRLSSLHNILEKKADAIRKHSQRQRQISFLVQQAANQKSAQQKQWNKVFFTNKFLHCILKNKISRQLSAHEVVQKTFQRIKLHTGINQADELVQKYLTRQQTYGELLGSISQKQPLLQKLQAQNQKLKSELKQLSEQQTFQISLSKKALPQNIQIKQKQRQLQKLSRKTISYERQKQAFYQWAIKFIKKYNVLTNQADNKLNCYQLYPRTQMQVVHKKVQSIITEMLDQANKNPQNVRSKLLENKLNSTMQSDMIERNMRIRTQVNQFQQLRDQQQGQQFNQLQFLAQHRRNIKRDQKHKRFRIKTSKAH